MPESVQSAYLVLLGQIVLITSCVFFGVPYFMTSTAPQQSMPRETMFYLAFIFFACSMMIANIIIGWVAVRDSSKMQNGYTNIMFILELLIITCFFAMNNVIMFSFGGSFSITDTLTVKKVMQTGVDMSHIGVTAASLYFLTAVFLLLCKAWNHEYYKVAKKIGFSVYERFLWAIIVAFVILSVTAFVFKASFEAQLTCFSIWILGWGYINGHWIMAVLRPARARHKLGRS